MPDTTCYFVQLEFQPVTELTLGPEAYGAAPWWERFRLWWWLLWASDADLRSKS